MFNDEPIDLLIDGKSLSDLGLKLLDYEIDTLPSRKDGGGINAEGLEGVIPLTNTVYNSATGTLTIIIEGESNEAVHDILRDFRTWVRSTTDFRKMIFTDDPKYFRKGIIQNFSPLKITSGVDNSVAEFTADLLFEDAFLHTSETNVIRMNTSRLGILDPGSNYTVLIRIDNDGGEVGASFKFGHDVTAPNFLRAGTYRIRQQVGVEQWTPNLASTKSMSVGPNLSSHFNGYYFIIDTVDYLVQWFNGATLLPRVDYFKGNFITLKPGINWIGLDYSGSEPIGAGYLEISWIKQFN